jgi:hypothetical protein
VSITILLKIPVTIVWASRPITVSIAFTVAVAVPLTVTSVIVSIAPVILAWREVTTTAARRWGSSTTRRSTITAARTITSRVKPPGCRWRRTSPLSKYQSTRKRKLRCKRSIPQFSASHHVQCACCASRDKHHRRHGGSHTQRRQSFGNS